MRISYVYLLVMCIITFVIADVGIKNANVRLPVHRPEQSEDKNPDNVNVLLATLFEMHHNLIAQISLLEDKLKTSLPTMETSEIIHMVQHFTAQKNNIEISINQIQSNDGFLKEEGRTIAKDSAIVSKSIPFFMNLFKRTQTQHNEPANSNIAYSLPYQPYYEPQPAPQPAPAYVYHQAQLPSIQPPPPPPNDLHESVFPGFDANQNGQILVGADESSLHNKEHMNQQFNQQYVLQPAPEPHYQTHPQQELPFEAVFRPQNLPVRRPQVPEFDTQRYQQSSLGQKEGVFIYYPNGLITDDKDRPSFTNRFGQAFDRFGQALSNFGRRQDPNNNSPVENGIIVVQRSESDSLPAKEKIKDKNSAEKEVTIVETKEKEPKMSSQSAEKQEKEADVSKNSVA